MQPQSLLSFFGQPTSTSSGQGFNFHRLHYYIDNERVTGVKAREANPFVSRSRAAENPRKEGVRLKEPEDRVADFREKGVWKACGMADTRFVAELDRHVDSPQALYRHRQSWHTEL